ncbi:MAG TPA: hypothetical protein VN923_08470, partial [Thermoanaerobaculia bacterium]|nr:hypothetical protein [Thermoanaerobaculia bacterium]
MRSPRRTANLAAALLGAVALFTIACDEPSRGATDRAGRGGGGFNPFAHRVELHLPPYLQQLKAAPLGLGDTANGSVAK